MRILSAEQRSELWHRARRGVITASEVGEYVAGNDTATNRKARQNLIAKKLAEPFYSDPQLADLAGSAWLVQIRDRDEKNMQYNAAVQRGIQLEEIARERYESMTGFAVTQVGLILHDSGGFGCSPDGLILPVGKGTRSHAEGHGLEIKCPIPETHLKYLLAGTLPDEYRPQVHCSLAVTGFDRWDFMSFCPGLPSLYVTVMRDDYTERMLAGLISLADELEATRLRLATLWSEEFENA